MPTVGAVGSIVALLSGPAVPIVIPIVAVIVLGIWIFELNHKTYSLNVTSLQNSSLLMLFSDMPIYDGS